MRQTAIMRPRIRIHLQIKRTHKVARVVTCALRYGSHVGLWRRHDGRLAYLYLDDQIFIGSRTVKSIVFELIDDLWEKRSSDGGTTTRQRCDDGRIVIVQQDVEQRLLHALRIRVVFGDSKGLLLFPLWAASSCSRSRRYALSVISVPPSTVPTRNPYNNNSRLLCSRLLMRA